MATAQPGAVGEQELATALGESWPPPRRRKQPARGDAIAERLAQVAARSAAVVRAAVATGDSPLGATLLALVAVHAGPLVPLAEVSQRYFGLSPAEAKRAAALNRLPVPAFRLTPSRKAPLVMSAAKLAEFIDQTEQASAREWEKSQV